MTDTGSERKGPVDEYELSPMLPSVDRRPRRMLEDRRPMINQFNPGPEVAVRIQALRSLNAMPKPADFRGADMNLAQVQLWGRVFRRGNVPGPEMVGPSRETLESTFLAYAERVGMSPSDANDPDLASKFMGRVALLPVSDQGRISDALSGKEPEQDAPAGPGLGR